jgi:membrane-bound serine protease (ClpP class)
MEGLPVVRAEPTGFEKLAWWVKYLSPVLILVGLGAAYAEMKAPGFGVGGAISLAAFSLFFFGNYAAGNMAGYELAVIFAVGILLIALEIFVIPGTGIAGIVGLLLMVGTLFFAMIDSIDLSDFGSEALSGPSFLELIAWPALSLAIGLFGGVVLAMFLMRFLPDTPLFGWLTLKQELASGAAMDEHKRDDPRRVGWTGAAATDLRPVGKATFQGEVLDVAVEGGGFVAEGAPVRIVSEDGMGILVKEIPGMENEVVLD